MRLSDVVSAMGMTVFPIIGLLMFVSVFVAMAWKVARATRTEMDACAHLPLEGGEPHATGARADGRGA